MGRTRNDPLIGRLALAVSTGQTIASWCRTNGVNYHTASEWSRVPQFKRGGTA